MEEPEGYSGDEQNAKGARNTEQPIK